LVSLETLKSSDSRHLSHLRHRETSLCVSDSQVKCPHSRDTRVKGPCWSTQTVSPPKLSNVISNYQISFQIIKCHFKLSYNHTDETYYRIMTESFIFTTSHPSLLRVLTPTPPTPRYHTHTRILSVSYTLSHPTCALLSTSTVNPPT